jgi:hypothetical protein
MNSAAQCQTAENWGKIKFPDMMQSMIWMCSLQHGVHFLISFLTRNVRCWHGCGYLGTPGKPICRFFLLRNKLTPNIKVSVLSGKDIFV